MAKVSFTKLGLKKNEEVGILHINEQIIEVKQYLPINEKLELISSVINSSADENNFSNPVKENVFLTLEILYHYTNINFTDKQKEDPVKLYDLVVSSGLNDKQKLIEKIKKIFTNPEMEQLDSALENHIVKIADDLLQGF